MSSLCQVRADTNLGIEKFYFSIFVPLFEIVLRSGCCGGGCPLQSDTNRIQKHTASVNWKACVRVLPVSCQSACRVRVTCQSSERVPRRPAALKQCSVTCPCCLASQSERALRLRSAACQGTPSMLCRLSGHPVHALPPVRASRPRPAACQGIPSAPTWDKMLLCGKICHKSGNLGNEKN